MSKEYNDKYLLTRPASLIYRWYKEESVVHAREREKERDRKCHFKLFTLHLAYIQSKECIKIVLSLSHCE